MSEVLQANVFFFITSIAVVVFSVLVCIAVYYVIKILKTIRRITDRIDEGTETIAEDVSHVREFFTSGSMFSHILGILVNMSGYGPGRRNTPHRTRRSRTTKKDKDSGASEGGDEA